ncbi:MAG TPA: ABC transporter permease [Longimicrobiales bacterium]
MNIIRFAARSLLRAWGVAAVVVVTLASGIAVVTGLFALLNGWAWADLPYERADRIMAIGVQEPRESGELSFLSPDLLADVRSLTPVFAEVAAYEESDVTLRQSGSTRIATVTRAEPGLFPLLRVGAAAGRLFSEDDADDVALLTHHLWRDRFDGSPAVIGQTVYIEGRAHTVIGVLPESFVLKRAEVVVPLRVRAGDYVKAVGRLRDGVTPDMARQRVGMLTVVRGEDYRAGSVMSINEDMLERVSFMRASFMLIPFAAATLFVLLIACANVLTLLLARGIDRRADHSIRAALGASRFRLALENFVESCILAAMATALGVLFASWGLKLFVAYVPANFPPWLRFPIDGNVALFAGCAALTVMVAIGWAPAREAGRAGPISLLNKSTATKGGSELGFGRRLVITEVALAAALFIGMLLMVRSLNNTRTFDVGYDDANIATAPVRLDTARFRTDTEIDAYLNRVNASLARIPGALTAFTGDFAGFRSAVPNSVRYTRVSPGVRLGDVSLKPDEFVVVSPAYFDMISVKPLAGRLFRDADVPGAPLAAVVTSAFADRIGGAAAVGKTLRLEGVDTAAATVVGIVPDRNRLRSNAVSMFADQPDLIFLSSRQARTIAPTFLLKNARGVTEVRTLLAALHEADPDVATWGQARLLEDANRSTLLGVRITAQLLGILAALALSLAMLGLFGVLAYSTRARTREIGVRMALGATARTITRQMMGETLRLIGIGLVGGALLGMAIGRLLGGFLLDVPVVDPVSLVTVVALFNGIALLAAWLPIRRALHNDPISALRPE